MDEMLLAAIVVIASALPGLALGLMLLTGKWNPPSFRQARDPLRARVATGRLLVVVDSLVLALGAALLVLPRERALPLVTAGVAIVLVLSAVMAIAVVRAQRA